MVQHLTVVRIAEVLAVAWSTANDAVLAEGKRVLINDPARFDGVKVIGIDEHVWRHTRKGDKYVTVIIDLTAIRDDTGPSRLLDMIDGWSKQAFKTWLADLDPAFRDAVEGVAMHGFTGFKTATTEELPHAVAVMDPFHVVRLAGDALDRCRRRIQLATCGHRGRASDPLHKSRRTLHTGADPLTDKQKTRLEELFANEDHLRVEATWGIYQRMITAYREPDRSAGRKLMQQLITSLSSGVPRALTELVTLGRTFKKAGRRRARLLRPTRHVQRPDGGDQRTAGTPTRLGARLPESDQLHRQIAAGDRRVQTATTPSNGMSPLGPRPPCPAPCTTSRPPEPTASSTPSPRRARPAGRTN